MPQCARLGQVLGDHGIAGAAQRQRVLQQRFHAGPALRFGNLVGAFQQHAVRYLAEQGHALLREMAINQAQRELVHHLEAGQAGAQLPLRQAEQLHGVLHRRHGGPGGELRGRQRVQLHGRRGDDAQRAFAANEQVAQVVAGVVLAQAAQAVPDLALRRHHLQTQAQFARIAVAQHLGAASVATQVAANGATAFGRQAQRKQKAGLVRVLLQRLQYAAGFHGDGQVGAVQRAYAVQAPQTEHDLAPAGVWRGAAHQTGVAALRHQGHAGFGAGAHDRGDFGRRARLHHGQRAARMAFAPVLLPGREVLGQHSLRADNGGELLQQAFHAGPSRCSG